MKKAKSAKSKSNQLATKDDVNAVKVDVNAVRADVNDLREEFKKYVTLDIFNEFKDKVYTLFDKVMGELKAIREEQTIITGKSSEYADTFENHENRISKLETSTLSP